MENVLLIVHLVLALCLIGIVLIQRSEGGGLGIGGGGSVSGRAPTTPLAKVTWGFAGAFLLTSILLTVAAARNSADSSVIDRLGVLPPPSAETGAPAVAGGDLLPPAATDAPLPPPRAD